MAECDRFLAAEAATRIGCESAALKDEDVATIYAPATAAADVLAQLRPATMKGLRATARVVRAFYEPESPDQSIVDACMWTVITTLAGGEVLS